LERETGVEPATSSLGSLRSTPELLPLPILRGFFPFGRDIDLRDLFKIGRAKYKSQRAQRRLASAIGGRFARRFRPAQNGPDQATDSADRGATKSSGAWHNDESCDRFDQ
jgi:hypothetical protein